MKIRPHVLATTLVLALSGLATAIAADVPVLAQELNKVRASGKVLAALWTARPDSYTLQLVMPVTGNFGAPAQASRTSTGQPPAPKPTTVQVWLLKADGTVLLPASESVPPPATQLGGCGRCVSYEIRYSFAHATGREAVAAAIRINDEFYIEALKSLRND